MSQKIVFKLEKYWDIDKQAARKISEKQAIVSLERIVFRFSIKRLRSDVPVGASLSGGLDSSSIVYYIHKHFGHSNH